MLFSLTSSSFSATSISTLACFDLILSINHRPKSIISPPKRGVVDEKREIEIIEQRGDRHNSSLAVFPCVYVDSLSDEFATTNSLSFLKTNLSFLWSLRECSYFVCVVLASQTIILWCRCLLYFVFFPSSRLAFCLIFSFSLLHQP